MALRATNVNEEFRPQPSRDRQGAVAPIRHDLQGNGFNSGTIHSPAPPEYSDP